MQPIFRQTAYVNLVPTSFMLTQTDTHTLNTHGIHHSRKNYKHPSHWGRRQQSTYTYPPKIQTERQARRFLSAQATGDCSCVCECVSVCVCKCVCVPESLCDAVSAGTMLGINNSPEQFLNFNILSSPLIATSTTSRTFHLHPWIYTCAHAHVSHAAFPSCSRSCDESMISFSVSCMGFGFGLCGITK